MCFDFAVLCITPKIAQIPDFHQFSPIKLNISQSYRTQIQIHR
ncbi:hypothetical protein GXM_10053 [Nostoc sphaeroides CCNUC1]|uniref:Uncharacterized protein n=1 Tax=Nostoc sphaeroides CCNUC1 TaxID=2653204 RepID=A0A5P8WLM2_9NOSO|nr:hypothetical protein GXM_10053 [Nostoc sphaeroides CCNUC1]